MYNNTTPNYPQGYGNYPYPYPYGYYGYQTQQHQPPGDAYQQQTDWSQVPGMQAYPPQPPLPPTEPKKEVVQEIQQQKATLTKQREDYVKKAMVLRREMEELKLQKQGLAGNEKSEKELRYVLKENERLQDEINSKLKAILNVIEMLSSIIKDGKKAMDLEAELEQQDSKPEAGSHTPKTEPRERSSSPNYSRSGKDKTERDSDSERHCYVYYDTGMHWCRACDKFPDTAKEFLQHLQSERHQDQAKENEVDTTPWHKLPMEPLMRSYDDAPKKRVPIKGLQFFISAPSWYCKLCDIWIGDLHCASHHLKSQTHFQNYENFVKQNPHWETEWLKDREIAMSRSGKQGADSTDSDKQPTKKRHRRRSSDESFLKEKKKKKRSKKKKKKEVSSDSSSSSSSSSDSSSGEETEKGEDKAKSIRVAMRNMQQVKSIMDEDMTKWSILEKLMQDVRKKEDQKEKSTEDEVINQWMTISNPVPETEKNLLESLKDRMKAKQEMEKAKIMEVEKRRKEKEREEQELYDKKRRQEQDVAEKAEKERKRKEEEMNRVLDKDRSHVRFKTAKEHTRKRRSSEEEDGRNHRAKSSHRDDHRKNSRAESPQFRPRKSTKADSPEPRDRGDSSRKKPPGPPSYKKLPFIGRMPLFKKRVDKGEKEKEIKLEEYEPRRKTRFETGNLAKAYIPRPDVVCFPVLSSIPPISAPPEPTAVEQIMPVPPPREVNPPKKKEVAQPPPPPPPPPAIPAPVEEPLLENNYVGHNNHSAEIENAYYPAYQSPGYDTAMHPPLEPPPLPPDDDLAMLGICADDMAAQSF
ncbi:zinc finger matrin-type protein CG9776-like isoform X1 [Euwallacea fornicatus]|uniref:zinc finger matrin-type protein CG9776-like isoform X1 n=2 Tax=Euwallacea fornicatus TaxID=995702 RepID=UPI00338DC828